MQNPDNEQPQDFELIDLLFRKPPPIKRATRKLQQSGATNIAKSEIFESFQSRFQSFIDQIPSYLHSSGKPGFFTHFFLGSFTTLLDTELKKTLNVKNLYFRFDGANTLKVVAETGQKTHVFIFTEDSAEKHSSDQVRTKKFEFTEDELTQINEVRKKEQSKSINEKDIVIQLVHIEKSGATITVDVEKDKSIKRNAGPPPTKFPFQKITPQREQGDYLENDIRQLADSESIPVETALRKVLAYIKRTHAALNLSTTVYGSEAREANQHGFVAGFLDNFRYRHNTRIYLEQFAGRGYADIVLLVRGSERSVQSIPIVIELKADNPKIEEKTLPSDALKQAKDKYIPGFQPNTVRVLTLSDNIISVGLNLDYVPTKLVERQLGDIKNIIDNWDNNDNSRNNLKGAIHDKLSKFIEINSPHLTKIIDEWQGNKEELKGEIQRFIELAFKSEVTQRETQNIRPPIVEILQSTQRSAADHLELQEQIRNHLERAYNTFPGTKESRNNHYFSRFLLGQSTLLSDKEYKKQVFHYKKADIIPTEELPERTSKQPPRAAKTKNIEQSDEKTKEKIDISHAITTVVFTPTDVEDPVILLNIIESNRDTPINKKIELTDNIVGSSNRAIIKLNVQFRTDNKKETFEQYCSIQSVERYDNLGDYNTRNPANSSAEVFQGEFKNIPYPSEFKEAFDKALSSQKNENFSNTDYKQLFQKISEGISPFRSLDPNLAALITEQAHYLVALITEEAHFQGVLHGSFSHYSDLKLAELPATRALVLTEFQTGKGKRIDMLIHGIGPELDFKEFKSVGLEFKGPRLVDKKTWKYMTADKLMEEAKEQLKNYYAVVYKTLTDGDEVQLIPVVFDIAATDASYVIRLGDELFSVVVVHSSVRLLPPVTGSKHKLVLGKVEESMELEPQPGSSSQQPKRPRTAPTKSDKAATDPDQQRPHTAPSRLEAEQREEMTEVHTDLTQDIQNVNIDRDMDTTDAANVGHMTQQMSSTTDPSVPAISTLTQASDQSPFFDLTKNH